MRLCQDLGLETNDWQDRVVGCHARNVILRGARRIGKSYTLSKRHFPLMLAPKSMHWIVGPTYDLAEKEFRYFVDFFRRLSDKQGIPFKTLVPRYRHVPENGDLLLETMWGARLVGKSATNMYSLVGEACDSVMLAEAAQLSRPVWERYVRPTLSTKQGYATFGSTPDSSGEWLYQLEMQAAGMDDWAVFHQAAWECPHYPPGEVEAAKRDLSEDAFYEQYGGEWRFYHGRVYKLFKADLHLVEPFPIPASWKIISGSDWGSRDPTACEWGAQSPTGELYIFGEYYVADAELSTEDHAVAKLRMEEQLGVKGRPLRIADHHGLGTQLIVSASRAGFKTAPCRSEDRKARRDAALAACTPRAGRHPYHIREAGGPPGDYPNVFVFKDRCPNLVRELQFLTWREGMRREGAMNDTKGDDHAIDCFEYMLEYWNVGASGRTRRAAIGYKARTYDPTGYYALRR
ncbi:MAG: hypothetical protein ACRCZI_02095 [Cetobacterium sp.]